MYTCKCVWQCQISKTRSFTTVAAVVISFVWNSICICFRDAIRMHIRSRHVTQICSDLAPSCPSCRSLQRTVQSSRRHFTAAPHKRRKGLPLPLLGFSVLESLFRSLPLVSCPPGEMPPHLLNVLLIPLRWWGHSEVSRVPLAEMPNPTLSPSAPRDPSTVQCLGCGEKGLGAPRSTAVSKHIALLTATSTPGAHTKSAKSTHAWIAEVEQSDIPPLKTWGFKY